MRKKKSAAKSSGKSSSSNRMNAAKQKMMDELMAKRTGTAIPVMTNNEKIMETVQQRADDRLLAKYADRSEKFKTYMKHQIEHNAAVREAERRKKATMVIKPRGFKNGRLAGNGKVYDSSFKIILTIGKDGYIRNKMGMKVGKYDPSSPSKMFKLERLVEKYANGGGGFF